MKNPIQFLREFKASFFKKVSEKRKYPRVPISVKVTNLSSGNFTYYQASNISAGGMFIKADEPLSVGSELRLRFSLPGAEDIKVHAKVVRNQSGDPAKGVPSGMGIRFIDVGDEDREVINQFIDMKT